MHHISSLSLSLFLSQFELIEQAELARSTVCAHSLQRILYAVNNERNCPNRKSIDMRSCVLVWIAAIVNAILFHFYGQLCARARRPIVQFLSKSVIKWVWCHSLNQRNDIAWPHIIGVSRFAFSHAMRSRFIKKFVVSICDLCVRAVWMSNDANATECTPCVWFTLFSSSFVRFVCCASD